MKLISTIPSRDRGGQMSRWKIIVKALRGDGDTLFAAGIDD